MRALRLLPLGERPNLMAGRELARLQLHSRELEGGLVSSMAPPTLPPAILCCCVSQGI